MRKWLKEIRLNKRMVQKSVAKFAGISQQHYNFIENGERNPHVETAKKIAEILNFDWTRFFEDVQTDKENINK